MRKHLILTVALLSLAALSSYAQKTTTMEYNRERVYTVETKTKTVWYQGELTFGAAYSPSLTAKVDDNSWKGKISNIQPNITTIHGIRITKWAFVGIGVSFIPEFPLTKDDVYSEDKRFYYEAKYNRLMYNSECAYDDDSTMLLPVFANVKGYYPVTDRFSVYATLSFGKSILIGSEYEGYNDHTMEMKAGYYGEYGLGLNYRKFNFCLGLEQQQMKASGDKDYSLNAKTQYLSFFVKLGLKW